MILLILVELGCAAFFYFDKSWREVSSLLTGFLNHNGIHCYLNCTIYVFFCFLQEIPADRTGDFNMIYDFLKENWNIVKWVALGVVILQVR